MTPSSAPNICWRRKVAIQSKLLFDASRNWIGSLNSIGSSRTSTHASRNNGSPGVTSTSSETPPIENRQGDRSRVIARTRGRFDGLAVFGLYTAISLFCFARALPGHPGFYIGRDTDPPQTMWFFNWGHYSLSQGVSP